MAVFREVSRGLGFGVQAIVRKRGYSLSRVLPTKRAAQEWAGRVEAAIAVSGPDMPFHRTAWLPTIKQESIAPLDDSLPHGGWTLDRALKHYGERVSPLKKGWRQETRRIAAWRRHSLATKRLDSVNTADVQSYANSRVAEGRSGSTVRHDVMLLRALYRDAVKMWKLSLTNPCAGVELPSPAPHRERRLEDGRGEQAGEEQRLRAALATRNRGDELVDLFDLATATGLRLSELLPLRAEAVRSRDGLVSVELGKSKNGHGRRVVLDSASQAIVHRRLEGKETGHRLFTVSESARARAWAAARCEAGVTGLRWHDLRHEALSRMANKGLHIGELQAQSGHRTPTMLLRYVNARAADIKGKLG